MKAASSFQRKSKRRLSTGNSPAAEMTEAARLPLNSKSAPFALLLFLSGMAALIYQVLWIRQLSLVVGVEVFSITIAVSAFFAGLAAGGFLFGRLADGSKRPLRLYCILEAGVALTGIFATILLAHAASFFVMIESHARLVAWFVPFLLVGMPAFFMGGTLPVAIRSQTRALVSAARAGSWVYAVNTAGGIAGSLFAAFALIPSLGVRGTAFAAALFNLAAAALALMVERSTFFNAAREVPVNIREAVRSRTALVLYGIAGGIALGYEVVWSQALAQFMSTRVFAFSVMLSVYLAGLALGSAIYSRIFDRFRDAWGLFALLISSAGFVALIEIAGLTLWQLQFQSAVGELVLAATGSEFARMCTLFAVAAIGVVFLPTLLLGAAFPAVLRLTVGPEHTGRDVGAVLSLNTAGGIAGTLVVGFWLVPALGLVKTLGTLAIAAAAVGGVAAVLGDGVSRRMRWIVASIGLCSAVCGLITPPDRLSRLLLTTRSGGILAFYEEGRGATVAVAEHHTNTHAFRRLYIQGVSNSGDAMPSLRYMRLQAMLPLLIHRNPPRTALVIGFGTGITAGAVLRFPGLERRVCVELLPAVVRAGSLFPENYGANSDPRMQIRIGDGRQELLRHPDRYDLITLEPPPPSAEGVVNLYSTDFYRLAGSRLDTNGLFAQWLPLATQNEEDSRSLVRSFLDVFPYATLWTTELHEMLLIGSYSPIELDVAAISDRFERREVKTTLQAVGIASPADLIATWVTGRDGLERFAGHARPVTDNDPRIEYAAWVRPKEVVRTLPDLLNLYSEPPLMGANDPIRSDILHKRESLWAFYSAGLAAYNGDRQRWSEAMQTAVRLGGDNPYYRWLLGVEE